MTDILLVARAHVVTALRERITLFWFMVFPVFLLVVLSLVFGSIGEEGQISFDIALVNLDRGSADGFSSIIEGAFDRLGHSDTPGHEPLFRIHKPPSDADVDAFIAEETLAVRRGRRAALVVLPEGLGSEIRSELVAVATSTPASASGPSLVVYYSEGSATSSMAVSIIDQVLAGIDREILIRGNQFDPSAAVSQATTWVGSTEGQTAYVDFLLPGIVLMGLFMNGLFGIPGAILFSRDQRVLRRYWVTPLTVPRFLAGTSLGHVGLSALQFAILYAVGRFALGATVSFASIPVVLLLLLATVTFMAFGFLIASVSKTGNSGMAIANILNMPMMFLSGLFFPITGLPPFIRAVIYVNPLSYLADGLRATMGVDTALFPITLVIAVPVGWIALSSAVAAWRLRWDVGR